MTNGIGGCFVAQQQSERVNEDGFSGAGLASQQIEARRELDGDVVNDRVVFDPQFQQHVSSRLSEVKRSVAWGFASSRPYFELELAMVVDQLEIGAVGGDEAGTVRPRCQGDEHIEMQVAQVLSGESFIGTNLRKQLSRFQPVPHRRRKNG